MAFGPTLRPRVADGLELAGCNAKSGLSDLRASVATNRLPYGRLHCAAARSPRMDLPSSADWHELDRSASRVVSRMECSSSSMQPLAAPCANITRRHCTHERMANSPRPASILLASGTAWFAETRDTRDSRHHSFSPCTVTEPAHSNARLRLRLPPGDVPPFRIAKFRPLAIGYAVQAA